MSSSVHSPTDRGLGSRVQVQEMAWWPVLTAAFALASVLTALSAGYGYHRDELYFRMLPADLGYVDQPPLTPWLARTTADLLADEAWAGRTVAILSSVVTVLLVALLVRELGGSALAQGLAAWGYAGAASTLMFGHVLLPATVDLAVWTAIALTAARAALRDPRWWVPTGLLIGIGTYNRWLVVVLALGIAVGVLLLGPRSALRSRWLWSGVVLALLTAAPNLLYQAQNAWPQVAMGAALGQANAGEVRTDMWLLLVLLLGPPLLPIWVWGLGHLMRTPDLRDLRFLGVTLLVLLVFTYVSGAQPHYFLGPLVVMYTVGCVPLAAVLDRHPRWCPWAVGALVLNGSVSVILALPVLPVPVLARTPIPDISPLVADQIGWPRYVDQVATAYRAAADDASGAVAVISANYGEAGAVARYGPEAGLPPGHSGHNHLHQVSRPTDDTSVVVIVGGQIEAVHGYFATCRTVDHLDSGTGISNEEEGQPLTVCTGPDRPWVDLWPEFAHLD